MKIKKATYNTPTAYVFKSIDTVKYLIISDKCSTLIMCLNNVNYVIKDRSYNTHKTNNENLEVIYHRDFQVISIDLLNRLSCECLKQIINIGNNLLITM